MENHSEQAENSIFFQQLDTCCQKIAEQVGEKPIAEWTNGDYIKLSGLLSRKTKIHLSESTLKRIFGKSRISNRYYPQKATRDALAQFIGYRDWYEFEFRNTTQVEKKVFSDKPITEHKASIENDKTRLTWLFFAGFLLIAFILAIIVLKPSSKNDALIKKVKLSCINPDGLSPHSAIFKLDVKGNMPDSSSLFSIDFGDGRPGRTNFADPMVNHYYELPGRYYPLLFYKNKVIDTGYVYLQTRGWSATGSNQNDTTRVYPIVLPNIAVPERAEVSAREAAAAGVDTLHTFFVAFTNVKPTGISGDNFELSTHVMTSTDRTGIRCSQIDISIYGETDLHTIGIIKPECVAWTRYKFSENAKDGKKYDLRMLGHNLSKGGNLNLQIQNKQVRLSIDSKEVLKTGYEKSIGRIMGIKISFSGIGHFENFQLSDLKTKEKF